MIIRSQIRAAGIRPAHVCARCLLQRRRIHLSHLARLSDGREQWKQWATEIRAGKRQSVLQVLEERGFVHQIAGQRVDLDKVLVDKRIGVYVGIDPTAPSLHIGHMVPLMALFWMHLFGYHTVSLIGATTAKIGDPTGRTKSRPEMTPTERKAGIIGMQFQLKKLWINLETVGKKYGYIRDVHWHREVVNNATWWNKLPMWDVLRTMGRHTRLGPMLTRDTVEKKMASAEGMSFAEFCYPLMQAWDWWYMFDTKKIQMQIGGSDQYGNIIAGVDAIKDLVKNHEDPYQRVPEGLQTMDAPYGFTTPLLTTSSGQKFGKSEGNAIWLDSDFTPVFELYGFFVRTADADVEKYLKLFTFIPLPEIKSIMEKHKDVPHERIAQHRLAFEFVELVQGKAMATAVQGQHAAMFSKPTLSNILRSISAGDPAEPPELITPPPVDPRTLPGAPGARTIPERPYYNPGSLTRQTYSSVSLNPFARPVTSTSAPSANIVLPVSLIYNQPFSKVLFSAGLVSSISEGNRLCQQKGAYVGSKSSNSGQMSDEIDFRPVAQFSPDLTWKYVIRDHESGAMEKEGEEGLMLLRVGKWNVRLIRVVKDEIFEKMGLDAPGWGRRKEELAQSKVSHDSVE